MEINGKKGMRHLARKMKKIMKKTKAVRKRKRENSWMMSGKKLLLSLTKMNCTSKPSKTH